MNDAAFLAAEFPSENLVTDARSLARMYAATVTEVDGVRLLDPATVEMMTVVGFAYVPNLWSWNIAEPRARNLAAAVAACLGA